MEIDFDSPFELLPQEILVHILSFLPRISDILNAALVCHRFHEITQKETDIFKFSCINWWNEKDFAAKKLDICWAQKESKHDWKWFAKCFSKDSKSRLSWHLEITEELYEIRLGEMDNSRFIGCGINIFPAVIAIRTFNGNNHAFGSVIWRNGDRYEGQFNTNDNFEGIGALFWSDGSKYEGEWKGGKRHGRGVFAWPDGTLECTYKAELKCGKALVACKDGFRFESEFEDDLPKDENGSIHPSVIDCIHSNICTLSAGSIYLPQYLYDCETCDMFFCNICWQSCKCHDVHSWKRRWRVGSCDCGQKEDCKTMPSTSRDKRRKLG